MRLLILTPPALVLALPVLVRAEDTKKEEAKFQGEWKLQSIEENGRKAPDDEAEKFKITIKGDKFLVKSDLQGEMSFTIKVMPGEKPSALDLMHDDDVKKEKKVLGIYKFDGDKLTICATQVNKDRPTEFVAGKGVILVVLKRQK